MTFPYALLIGVEAYCRELWPVWNKKMRFRDFGMQRKPNLNVVSRCLGLLIAAFALADHTPVRAATLQFSGTFTTLEYAECEAYSEYGHCTSWVYTQPTNSSFANGSALSIGDAFAGSLTYLDTVPFTVISYSGEQAVAPDAVQSSTFISGQIALPAAWLGTGGLGHLTVSNFLHGHDLLSLQSRLGSADDVWTAVLTLDLLDTTGTLLTDREMPDSNFYSEFTEGWFSVQFVRNSDFDFIRLSGPISSLAVVGLLEPGVMLKDLGAAVVGIGPGKSLADKIKLAQTYYAVPDPQATCAILADFGNEVRAKRGKKIAVEVADDLIEDVQAIMSTIGCE